MARAPPTRRWARAVMLSERARNQRRGESLREASMAATATQAAPAANTKHWTTTSARVARALSQMAIVAPFFPPQKTRTLTINRNMADRYSETYSIGRRLRGEDRSK